MTKTRKGFYLRAFYYMAAWWAGLSSLGFSALLYLINDSRVSRLWPFMFLVIGSVLIYSIYKMNRRTRTRVKDILKRFKCAEFSPDKDYEIVRIDTGMYFGIDTQYGTMLMASTYDKVFKGMHFSDFSGYSCTGNVITLKFNDLKFSSFKLHAWNESKCMEFAHRLDVLLSGTYRPAKLPTTDFRKHVQQVAMAS